MQGDTEEPPPPEQQQRLPRGGVRAGAQGVGRGGHVTAWGGCGEGSHWGGRVASVLCLLRGDHTNTTYRLQCVFGQLVLVDNGDGGQWHELGIPSALLHDAGSQTRSTVPTPVCSSPGVCWAHTYKLLGDCSGSEALTPQGMLDSIPVLCLTTLAMCNSQMHETVTGLIKFSNTVWEFSTETAIY